MAELHRDAHRLEHRDRVPTEVVPHAVGGMVEVAAGVDRHRHLARARVLLEQEELDLRVGVEGEAQIGGPGQRPLQHVARVGEGWGAIRQVDVTEHPSAARCLRSPWQHLKGAGVGLGQHVRLGDTGETLDRRAVETDALDEGALELGRRDGHRLEETEHIGEPQPHEADVPLLERPEHKFLLLVHVLIVPGWCFRQVTSLPGTKGIYRTSQGSHMSGRWS